MPDDDVKPTPEPGPETNTVGVLALLRQPLTKYQWVVGITAGIITIVATGGSLIGLRGSGTPPAGDGGRQGRPRAISSARASTACA